MILHLLMQLEKNSYNITQTKKLTIFNYQYEFLLSLTAKREYYVDSHHSLDNYVTDNNRKYSCSLSV